MDVMIVEVKWGGREDLLMMGRIAAEWFYKCRVYVLSLRRPALMTDHIKQGHSLAQSLTETPCKELPSTTTYSKPYLIFHQQLEVRKNQIAVHLLYVQIMKQFIRRLIQQHRSSQQSIFSSEDHIEKLYSAIKYYYNQSLSTYNHCVRQRESGERKKIGFKFLDETQSVISQKMEEKDCSFLEEQSQFSLPFEMPDLFKNVNFPKPVYNYRATNNLAFSPKEQPDFAVKKDEEETSSNSDSQSEDELKDYAEKAQLSTNSLMIGDFMANRIKRKPKQEKILLQLHNIFLKLGHNGRDTFYDRASIQLKNIQKSQVPL